MQMKIIDQSRTTARISCNLLGPIVIVLSILTWAQSAAARTCESLAQLALPNTKITSAEPVTSGEFTVPGRQASTKGLPAFCRVSATLTPSTDSDIKVEVWFPLSGNQTSTLMSE